MKHFQVHLFSCMIGAVLLALLLAPAVAQAQAAPWTVVPSPNASPGNNELHAVASVSANDVWAVGTSENTLGNSQTLILHWDGTAWSIVPSPTTGMVEGNLFGVAAVSTSDVWAVGDSGSGTLIEQWNGSSWNVVSSPSPSTLANLLFAVAIVSATDIWAVGESQNATSGIAQTLIEQWNGSSWSVVSSPNPGSGSTPGDSLGGAAADPSSGQAWAVGHFTAASGAEQTLTEFNP